MIVSLLVSWWLRGDWPLGLVLKGSTMDWFFFYFYESGPKWTVMDESKVDGPKLKPDAGLEPATVGLKVQRSTDWANQARSPRHHTLFLFNPYRHIPETKSRLALKFLY